MKILIVNSYVRENKGDAALVDVLAKQLKGVFPEAEVSVSGAENPKEWPSFYGNKNVGSLRQYATDPTVARPKRILRQLFIVAIGIFWPLLPFRMRIAKILPEGIRGELLAIEDADLVVSASGGYLSGRNSILSTIYLYYTLLPIRLAERIQKPTFLAPQSFGPFITTGQRRIIRKTLNNAILVFVRESKSYDLLKKMGIHESVLRLTVDPGFAHVGAAGKTVKNNSHVFTVGITARLWMEEDKQKKYEFALAVFIAYIEKKYGMKTILIPQVTSSRQNDDDRVVETRIKKLAITAGAHPEQITDELDHYEIKSLYSNLDFLIGTRFHSVIFGLTSYVPAIAIEYEHKTSGIMHDLNLDKWTIKIEDVTAESLNVLFDTLITKHDEYREYLVVNLPAYIQRTQEAPLAIKQAYERHLRDRLT